MNVVFAASEAVPFSKTGGLGDVAGALPAALARLGFRISLFTPYYARVRESGIKVEQTGVRFAVPVGENIFDAELLRGPSPVRGMNTYFVVRDAYYDRPEIYGTSFGDYPDNIERFTFFSRAVIEAAEELELEADVFHANDWQTALIPVYLKTLYWHDKALRRAKSVLTIHNIGYQGIFPVEKFRVLNLGWQYFTHLALEFYGKVNLLKGGIVFSDAITTVSKRYAEEITWPEHGAGLDGVLAERRRELHGIVNGVDYSVWDPSVDDFIARKYSKRDLSGKAVCKTALQKEMGLPMLRRVPLIGHIGRLADQKGFDIFAAAAEALMKLDAQYVVLGSGSERYQRLLCEIASARPEKMAARIAFDNALAHRIEAGSDVFLMPSRYEPCGLSQLYSLRYGTVPVVHATGGLIDTVTDGDDKTIMEGLATGFAFWDYTPEALVDAVRRAIAVYRQVAKWRKLQLNGMKQNWSWKRSAVEYAELYEKTCGKVKHRARKT